MFPTLYKGGESAIDSIAFRGNLNASAEKNVVIPSSKMTDEHIALL